MIYDKPVSTLMADAVQALSADGNRFAVADVVTWFGDHYPKVNPRTVRAHVIGMTVNNPSRHHFAAASKEPLMFRLPDGRLRPYDADVDVETGGGAQPGDSDDGSASPMLGEEGEAEFVLENHLEEFMVGNWRLVNWGRPLELWRGPDGTSGHQLSTPVGRLDFLCVDRGSNDLVVVELKRGHSGDRVVGQVARYMGWVRAHLAGPNQAVQGIVVAHECDDGLRYAATALPGLSLLTYEVTFTLRAPAPVG